MDEYRFEPYFNDKGSHTNCIGPDSNITKSDIKNTGPETNTTKPDTTRTRPDTDHIGPLAKHIGPDTNHKGPDTYHIGLGTNRIGHDTGNIGPDANHIGPDINKIGPDINHKGPGNNDTYHIESDTNHIEPDTNRTTSDINYTESDTNTPRWDTNRTGIATNSPRSDRNASNNLEESIATLRQHLKILFEIFIENTFKQRMVIGLKIESEDGIATLKQFIEITKAFSLVQVQFWVINTDVIKKSKIDEKYAGDARFITADELNDPLIKSTDLLVYEPGSTTNGILSKIADKTMVLLQSSQSADNEKLLCSAMQAIARRCFNNIAFTLLKSSQKSNLTPHVIHVDSDDFQWMLTLRHKLAEIAGKMNERIWLVATQNKATGLVGFVNCLLQESKVDQLR